MASTDLRTGTQRPTPRRTLIMQSVANMALFLGLCAAQTACKGAAAPTPASEAAPAAAPTKNFFPEKPKIDYSQVRVDAPVEAVAAAAPVADTWASRTRALVAEAHADLQRCRNDFMIPFQFEKMRLRDVTWIAISEMDIVCRDGDPAVKKRGPWSILTFLAREHLGKHPALDRFLFFAHDQTEHARLVSLMTKKVGSPMIAKVVVVAQVSRDRAIEAGREVDAAAREIAAWPDDLLPDDSAEVISQGQSRAEYVVMLRAHYGALLDGAVPAYDRLASTSWQAPNMVKKTTLRLWADTVDRLLQHDRPRLDKVRDLDDAGRKKLQDALGKVQGALDAWKRSFERYFEDKEGDTWAERDPWRPALVKAQRDWRKAFDGLGK